MESALTVYKASAGSGKTFTLAIRYIKALIGQENGSAYSHILAVTFTNKATAEMKDRILQQLYGIWKGLPSSESYMGALRKELQADGIELTDEEIRRRAGISLRHILHDYDRFRVETIDSFFQSVMRNLAHELGLSANLKVELNDKEALSEAVDRIMEHLHLTPQTLSWIMEYVDDRISESGRWDISGEVKGFATWIFKEPYLTREQGMRKALRDDKLIAQFRAALRDEKEEALDILKSAADHFRSEMGFYGVDYRSFNYGKSLENYLVKLENYELEATFGGMLEKYTDDFMNMLRKKEQKSKDMIQTARHLSRLLAELRQFQLDCIARYKSAEISLKHLNPLRLLGVIDEEVNIVNRENNRFLLAKTPFLLHSLAEESDAPFIFEKMGSIFRNMMIDEFQDTSSMQWGNFKTLLAETMASGYGSLIVGDVKQSIYRWRNGDWTILSHIADEMRAYNPDMRGLRTNFRSERHVIEFNNALFQAAASVLDDLCPGSPVSIADLYSDVAQECPPGKELKGCVKMHVIDASNKEIDWETVMLDGLCEEVRTLHEGGLPYSEMAILLRYRRHAAPIINHFATYFEGKVKLVSDEAFMLSGSVAVSILVTAMRYLTDPEDRVSAAYLALHGTEGADVSMLARKRPEDCLPAAFTERLNDLRQLPLYELQEELYKTFGLARIKGEDAYLFAYFDHVAAYLQDNPSDMRSFLKYWDESLAKESIPSSEVDGIRILTIHQSKGLQFHTVFVPYCDWTIEKDSTKANSRNDLLWCESQRPPYNMLPAIPITIDSKMRDSCFYKEYEEEHLQRRVDTLNTLYVAFTRAAKNLSAWCRANDTMTGSSTVGDLIYQAVLGVPNGKETTDEEDGIIHFTFGAPITTRPTKSGKVSDNRMESEYNPVPAVMRSYDSRIEFKQSGKAEEFMESLSETDNRQQSRSKRIRIGVLMHRIFSTIYTRNDMDKALRELETDGQIGAASEREMLKSQAEEALALPEVAHWFDGSMALYNECPILTPEKEGYEEKYSTYRPDRVMLSPDEAIVVDFKFGNLRKEHHEQVAGYMSLLRQMEPERRVKGYLWYIPLKRIEEIKA